MPWWGVLLLVLAAAALTGVAAFMYWKRREDRLRDEVADMLTAYMPMDDAGISSRSSALPRTVEVTNWSQSWAT